MNYRDYKAVKYRTKLPFFVSDWFDLMDETPNHFCKDQWALRNMIIHVFENEELDVKMERAEHYFSLSRYLGFESIEWERFFLGLHLCVYQSNGYLPRFDRAFAMMGRGNGKDGCISLQSLAMISPYDDTCPKSDVDICSNSKEQSMRPVLDILEALDSNSRKMSRFYKWTREYVMGLKNGGYIRGRADNSKKRDGMRSANIIFNEYHQYENTLNINVFKSGLGKKKESRETIYTTNGYIVDGPFDDMIKQCERILYEDEPDNGLLPFIFRLDDKKEVDDPEMWYKANPSLDAMPSLRVEIQKQYLEWKQNKASFPDFMTKRMNIRESNEELQIANWDDIKATNQGIPDMTNWECIVGIDFAKTSDWVGVNAHFKYGDKRYDINHAWICMQSQNISRLRCPYHEWAERGMITEVYAPEIAPDTIADYVQELTMKYSVKEVVIDNYRYTLMREALERVGFFFDDKRIRFVRPSNIMQTYPVIDRCFRNHYFCWGDQPVLRWSANNCKLIRAKKSRISESGENDIGNYLIGKIDPAARKTDPFMALVASMCYEEDLSDMQVIEEREYIPVFTF